MKNYQKSIVLWIITADPLLCNYDCISREKTSLGCTLCYKSSKSSGQCEGHKFNSNCLYEESENNCSKCDRLYTRLDQGSSNKICIKHPGQSYLSPNCVNSRASSMERDSIVCVECLNGFPSKNNA